MAHELLEPGGIDAEADAPLSGRPAGGETRSDAEPRAARQDAPTLSIGLPVYNGARWLTATLESLLGQSFTDFELIISDNASVDETEAICRALAAADPRVRYHRQPANIGIYRNHDAVFALARGRYFKWSACSDLCGDGFLERCVAVLEARPDVVLAYPRTRLLLSDAGDAVWDFGAHPDLDHASPAMRARRYLSHPYFADFNNPFHGVIRSDALRQTWLNRPLHGSDITMVMQLALLGRFVELPEYLFLRRYTPETDDTAAAMRGLVSLFGEGGTPIDKRPVARAQFYLERFVVAAVARIGAAEKLRLLAFLSWSVTRTALRFTLSNVQRLLRRR